MDINELDKVKIDPELAQEKKEEQDKNIHETGKKEGKERGSTCGMHKSNNGGMEEILG